MGTSMGRAAVNGEPMRVCKAQCWLVLLRRLGLSLLFGLLGSVPFVVPFPSGAQAIVRSCGYVFNLPVAMVSWLGIPYVVGIDVYRFRGVGEFMGPGEMLLWHLRVAVPLFLALLYLPARVRSFLMWRRIRGTRAPSNDA
jgi:hypothetical protein